jgi:hypothetical protein
MTDGAYANDTNNGKCRKNSAENRKSFLNPRLENTSDTEANGEYICGPETDYDQSFQGLPGFRTGRFTQNVNPE